jgi:hypothetical protein
VLIFTVVRVEDQLLSYEIIQTKTMSRFELLLLPDEQGEALMTHGESTFYRVAEAEDLVYLIQIDSNGNKTILKFEDYVSTAGVDMTESYWYTSGWLDDEDIAALQGGGDGTMGEILKIVYGVDSAGDIRSIRFGKCGDEDSVSRRVRIKTIRITDRETVARMYGMLASMTSMAYGQEWHSGSANARDEAYLNGEKPCRDSVVKAIRNHHTIAAAWFNEADVTLNGKLPGSVLTKEEAADGVVSISAEIAQGTITEVRVFSGAEVVFKANPGTKSINMEIPLKGIKLDKFIRVEAEGENRRKVMVSTPFFLD